MNCPVCDERLREIEKHGVKVDICPSCKGIWLDRGELEKMMDLADSGGPVAPKYETRPTSDRSDDYERREERVRYEEDREHPREGHGKRRKKESWLGEILGGFGDD